MLKLSKRIEYAVLALKYIAENSDEECLSTKVISQNAEIPYDMSAKILQQLVRSGIINSAQGNRGGYFLSISPNKINLGQIASAVDEDVQLTNCMYENASHEDCSRIDDCCIKSPLNKVQNQINEIFNKTFLNELVEAQ
jgi:Rrf2 family protein